ncbi:hypothetical protein HPULCUR_011064 [Helicostylum pulchrum]|uniref:Uncharacterized protein n=1 Tax=Helicostylum pulchrum TaxID=562976 RepID=A0ABP9YF09_9FUNG
MVKSIVLNVLSLFTLVFISLAKNVTDIKDCPALSRRTPSISVNDLRVDDIKVIGALGDSVTAGFGIMGFDKNAPVFIASQKSKLEYRGLSYSIGGDRGAGTMSNFINHFQPEVFGASIGTRLAGICTDKPRIDVLNGALSGAIAMNLDGELDYLISTMKSTKHINFENDWKMINIQIGSNDMCGACNTSYMNQVTPEKYGKYVDSVVDRIHSSIPKVIVNLISSFDLSQVFELSAANSQYCAARKDGTGDAGCSCAVNSEGLNKMKEFSKGYDQKLLEIYKKYQSNKSNSFAVAYQHCNFEFSKFSMEFFSTLDCFHPSLKGHTWLSKAFWNQLFLPQSQKPNHLLFNTEETIYCPNDSDRININ